MAFDSVELACGFYASGFSVRKNSGYTNHGLLKLKYYVCSKEGFKTGSEYSTLDDANNGKRKRRKPSKRTRCGAHIKFRLNDKNKYEVYAFEEEHNHSFVHKDDIQFFTYVRRLDYLKESVIQALSQVNLRPVRAFNILKSLYGGYEELSATKILRRIKMNILVNMMWIWYDLVLVPFTGIDNHSRNITLGAVLLGSETTESYRWLLWAYLNAFGSAPKVVVTDQDAAIKKAIQDVLPNSRHRLCMWHIWEKVTGKVGPATPNVSKFKEKLAQIVWTDSITTNEFEEKWHSILSKYGSTLVEFFSHFESAIEAQRYEHRLNDHVPRYTVPGFLNSSFVLESQAAKIFTPTIFFNQQLEIEDEFLKKKGSCCKYVTSARRIWKNGDDVEVVLRELRFAHEYIINKLVSDKEQLCLYKDYVKGYMPKADAAQVVAPSPSRRDRFA
ncbi:protein FAR1-RELATED SEQUENCE 5-like [Bidens hawaiensis]|uniref:protein FAR1-RELATED SEQUENCE 5-like n=1 Tax=Bidens hawaiensis TaxID=980011 RepID=UPI00404B6C88